jgi:hypothetical protein
MTVIQLDLLLRLQIRSVNPDNSLDPPGNHHTILETGSVEKLRELDFSYRFA